MPFVGEHHIEAREELMRAYEQSYAMPVLVDLRAETGFGKTRVLRAFYEKLAGEQTYWPHRLGSDDDRKLIYPRSARLGGDLPFLWLGISCRRDRDGGAPEAVFGGEVSQQLRPHAATMLLAEAKRQGRKSTVIKVARALGSLVGVEFLASALEILDNLELGRDIAAQLRDEAQRSDDVGVALDRIVDEVAVEALLGVVALLRRHKADRERKPLILVVDDAHDADATTLAAIERLLALDHGGVLVVVASWPSEAARQAEDGEAFGAVAQRLAGALGDGKPRYWPLTLPGLAREDLAELAIHELGADRDDAVVRADALVLAGHAHGNPLHLRLVADVARMNGVRLGSAPAYALERYDGTFTEILREHWRVYLSERGRRVLTTLSVLGGAAPAPILAAATTALAGTDSPITADDFGEVQRATWAALRDDLADREPTVDFADAPFAHAAAELIARLWPETRAAVADAAVDAILSEYADSRVHTAAARRAAASLGIRLVREGVTSDAQRLPELLFALAEGLDAAGDRVGALAQAEEAVDAAGPLPEVCELAALYAFRADRVDRAIELCALAGEALAARRAVFCTYAGDSRAAAEAAAQAFALERAMPGYHDDFEWDPPGVAGLIAIGWMGSADVPAVATEVAELVVASATGRRAEAQQWLDLAVKQALLSDEQLDQIAARTGLVARASEDDESPFPDEDEPLAVPTLEDRRRALQTALDSLAWDDPLVISARANLVAALIEAGLTDEAVTEAEALSETADKIGNPRVRFTALRAHGNALVAADSPDEAGDRFAEAVAIAEALGDDTRRDLARTDRVRALYAVGGLAALAPLLPGWDRTTLLGQPELDDWRLATLAAVDPAAAAEAIAVSAELVPWGSEVTPEMLEAAEIAVGALRRHVDEHDRPASAASRWFVEDALAAEPGERALELRIWMALEWEEVALEWIDDDGAAEDLIDRWRAIAKCHPDPDALWDGVRERWTAALGPGHPALGALPGR